VILLSGGYNSSVINHGVPKGVVLRCCRLFNYQWGQDYRTLFRGGCVRGNDLDTVGLGFNVTTDTMITMTGCYLYTTGQQAVSMSVANVNRPVPFGYMKKCTTTVDVRNLYPWGGGMGGTTQTYGAFFRGMSSPLEIDSCVFLSGTRFGGGRGIGFVGMTRGTETTPILIHNDSLDNHEGTSVEFGDLYYPSSLKIRESCWWLDIHNNAIIFRADTNSQPGAAYFKRGEAVIYQQEFDCGNAYDGPYHNRLYNNRIKTYAANRGTANSVYDLCAFKFESDFYSDTTTFFKNNYYLSTGNSVLGYGQYDGGGSFITDSGDTIDWQPVSNLGWSATFNDGGYCNTGDAGAAYDTVLDAIYLNSASPTSVIHRWETGEPPNDIQNITMARTLRIAVRGNNALPVTGANVVARDAYDNVRLTTPSRANGIAIGVVPYRFYSRTETDLNLTTYTISASKSSVSASKSMTVGWNAYQDTIDLAIAGDGVWDTGDVPLPVDTVVLFPTDDSVTEGGVLSFDVLLRPALLFDMTFNYTTADSTTMPGDFTATSGTDTIAAGDSTATITVQTTADATVENNEVLKLILSSFSSGVVRRAGTDSVGLGWIMNNDTAAVTSRTRTRFRK
jgi:hypothetical protein